jgi:hypothetical protein
MSGDTPPRVVLLYGIAPRYAFVIDAMSHRIIAGCLTLCHAVQRNAGARGLDISDRVIGGIFKT